MILNYFTIFALLSAFSGETNQTRSCRAEMIISNALPVQYWLTECDTFNDEDVDGILKVCWRHPWQCNDTIITQFTDTSGLDYDLQGIDESGSTLFTNAITEVADGIYQNTLIPESEDICNEFLRLKILLNGTEVAKSDYLDIKTTQRETKLWSYSNHRDFAGLAFTEQTPDPTFYIRVPCRFYHERYPQTDRAMELTSSVITTSSQKKTQRLLEVLHSPYYFHNKLTDILQSQTIEEGGTQWKKEEEYAINEGRKNWPLKPATCYLTQKNSVIRNVI